MAKKTNNEKLYDSKDMPKVIEVTDPVTIDRFGGNKMLISPPLEYDEVMKKVPYGKVITSDIIRKYLAKKHNADFTCHLTGGIFINIVAKASVERDSNKTPYWRTLKKNGELNEKYPDGIEGQKMCLEMEGHRILKKGKRYFVVGYSEKMFEIEVDQMKKVFCVIGFFILLFVGCSSNKVENVEKITYFSDILGKEMILQVYIPPGYSEDEKYPVLYFIADYGGTSYTVMNNYSITEKADESISNNEIFPLMIVGVNIDKSFGINSSAELESFVTESGKTFNKGMYSDYFCKEIIPIIDSRYSTVTTKDGRFVGGYSMGGYAALHIAFNNPDLFSKVGGHSPSLFIEDFIDKTVSEWLYPTLEIRKQRDPIYLAQSEDISDLSIFLDVEAGGSTGVEYLYNILKERDIDAVFMELGYSHNRTTCNANMETYLAFYAGIK